MNATAAQAAVNPAAIAVVAAAESPVLARPAMAVFAELRYRWLVDPQGSALAAMHDALRCAGTPVADVLALWNETDRTWIEGSPTVLRLEDRDVAVFPLDDEHVAFSFEPIDTDGEIVLPGPSGPTLRWRSFRPCSYAIGRRVGRFAFGTCERGLPVSIEARFDDGGRLTIGAFGCGSARAMRRTILRERAAA